MPSAAYYTYRNLRTGGYSVRHRGRVVLRAPQLFLKDVTFTVSEAGRLRVIKERRKNVHAFCVTPELPRTSRPSKPPRHTQRLHYNPYTHPDFYSYLPAEYAHLPSTPTPRKGSRAIVYIEHAEYVHLTASDGIQAAGLLLY